MIQYQFEWIHSSGKRKTAWLLIKTLFSWEETRKTAFDWGKRERSREWESRSNCQAKTINEFRVLFLVPNTCYMSADPNIVLYVALSAGCTCWVFFIGFPFCASIHKGSEMSSLPHCQERRTSWTNTSATSSPGTLPHSGSIRPAILRVFSKAWVWSCGKFPLKVRAAGGTVFKPWMLNGMNTWRAQLSAQWSLQGHRIPLQRFPLKLVCLRGPLLWFARGEVAWMQLWPWWKART